MGEADKTLDKLGEFVMANLRDPAIEFMELLAQGHWKAPSLQSLQSEVVALPDDKKALVRRCVVQAIDAAIHDFLFKVGEVADFEGDIQLVVDGQDVAHVSDGLAGEPYGDDGWQARFSRYGEST